MILDTCVLLWRAFEPHKLSDKAARAISIAKDIVVSSISVWEIGIKVKNRRLEIPFAIETFVERLKQIHNLKIIPVNETIWMESLYLPWKHRDPADRVIVATAKKLGYPIVTNDKIIKSFYKNNIW